MSTRKRTPLQKALIELRTRLGHSQESLAREMSVSLPTVGSWETTAVPSNITLARLAELAHQHRHEDLKQVFMGALEELKKTQARKAADILDEIARWHQIRDHLTALGEEADRLRKEKLKDTELPQRIIDRLYAVEKVLADAQRWSWRNR